MDRRYRLEAVRTSRSHDERAKRGDLAVAVGEARATADDVAAADRRVAAARAALATAETAPGLPTTAARLLRAEQFRARLRRDLDVSITEQLRTAAAHAGRLEQIDLARGRLVRARADRELVERHFTRWRDQQRKLADRRAD